MSSPFVAEVRMFPFNFAPKGWAFCDGQLLPISQNTALFSLLGTFYGGDGKSTFALPNFQGTVPVSQGQSTTGTQYFVGEQSGSENVTLIQSEIPVHTHNIMTHAVDQADLLSPDPSAVIAKANPGFGFIASQNTTFNPQALSITGSSFPHNNMMPFLTVSFCIALQGVFPARN